MPVGFSSGTCGGGPRNGIDDVRVVRPVVPQHRPEARHVDRVPAARAARERRRASLGAVDEPELPGPVERPDASGDRRASRAWRRARVSGTETSVARGGSRFRLGARDAPSSCGPRGRAACSSAAVHGPPVDLARTRRSGREDRMTGRAGTVQDTDNTRTRSHNCVRHSRRFPRQFRLLTTPWRLCQGSADFAYALSDRLRSCPDSIARPRPRRIPCPIEGSLTSVRAGGSVTPLTRRKLLVDRRRRSSGRVRPLGRRRLRPRPVAVDLQAAAAGTVTFGSNAADPVPKKALRRRLQGVHGEDRHQGQDVNTVDHNTFQEQINSYLQGQPHDVFTWFAGYRMQFFAAEGPARRRSTTSGRR